MSSKEMSLPEIEAKWREVQICAELLKSGQARIVTKMDKTEKEIRYTELKQREAGK